jgi:DNA-binding IclR family transcriptional regulator
MRSETDAGEIDKVAGVKSALRVLNVLEYFAAATRPATLAQLSKQLQLPKSSCFALLETLRQAGYVYWLGKEVGYYPTRRWSDLADAISRNDPILALTAHALADIRDRTSETAILAKRDGLEVLYLAVAEPDRVLRFAAYAGQRKPIHSASSGRALLGLMAPDERADLVARLERRRFSDTTLVEPGDIEAAIRRGITQGWHVSIGEYQADTTAIAASFRLDGEDYALVVGGPTPRIAPHVNAIGALLAEHAAALARAGGGRSTVESR